MRIFCRFQCLGGIRFWKWRSDPHRDAAAGLPIYRKEPDDPHQDYMIGCRILTQPFFFPEEQWVTIPKSWSPHIQQGRTYDTTEADGRSLWAAVLEREAQQPSP